jgi:hypothetical protein
LTNTNNYNKKLLLYFEAFYQLFIIFFNMQEINQRINGINIDLARRTTVTLAMVPITIVGVCNTLYTLLILSPALRARNQDIENRIANLEEFTGVTRPEQVQNYATRLLNTMGNCCKKNKKTKEQRQAKLTEYFSKDNNIESSLQNQDIEQGEPRLQISPEGSLQGQDTIHQRNVKKNTSLEANREL